MNFDMSVVWLVFAEADLWYCQVMFKLILIDERSYTEATLHTHHQLLEANTYIA